MRYYDNSRLSDYKNCPRYYFFRHVKGFTRTGTAIPLVNGLAWHDAMDVVWGKAHDDISDRELVKEALQAYVNCWTREGWPHPKEMTLEQQTDILPRGPFIAAETLMNYVQQRRDFIRECEILAIEKPFAVPLYEEENDLFYTLDQISQ